MMWATDEITGQIVDAATKLHQRLGPGLLESVYDAILARELARRGLCVERHRTIPFEFDGLRFDRGLVVDMLVEGQVVVEVKSVEMRTPLHAKQVLTYLRLLDLRVGLLVNFGCATMKEGLRRIVNGYEPNPGSPLAVNRIARDDHAERPDGPEEPDGSSA